MQRTVEHDFDFDFDFDNRKRVQQKKRENQEEEEVETCPEEKGVFPFQIHVTLIKMETCLYCYTNVGKGYHVYFIQIHVI